MINTKQELKEVENSIQFCEPKVYRSSQLVKTLEIIQQEECLSIAFNNDKNEIAVSSRNKIKIYEIQEKSLILIQTLEGHIGQIQCLLFIKPSYIISGAGFGDSSIQYWGRMNQKKWNNRSKVICKSCVMCIIVNDAKEQIISSHFNGQITFWEISDKEQIILQYFLQIQEKCIQQICLNNKETILVSIGYDLAIVILNKGKDQKFYFFQKIETENLGLRVQFIELNQFIWLQSNNGLIRIFDQDVNGYYYEQKESQFQLLDDKQENGSFFPCIYNSNLKIIFIKHSSHFYMILVENQRKLREINNLEYSDTFIFGNISNDGRKLAIWSRSQKLITLYQINYIDQINDYLKKS